MLRATTRFGELTGIETEGPSTRPHPVLFVHGWWGGAWVWDRFMERFAARGYASFAINLRGYHDSKRVADIGKVSVDEHVEDLRLASSALEHPILITHSASGLFALKLAETSSPIATIHLVPVPPAGFFSWRSVRVMAPYLPQMLRSRPLLLKKAAMIDADLNCLPPDEAEEVYAKMVPAPGRQGREMLGMRISAKAIRGPRLIQSGSDDRLIPPRIHRAMARAYSAEYREYPRHGHYLMREPGWEVVADDALNWLDEILLVRNAVAVAAPDV
ncbi:MAG TPA: alpha/beta fold hydrolase [Kofleriaceae bacterium]|nr:alpha/beta fold hydrolase [Kofleriaceae bacterium]